MGKNSDTHLRIEDREPRSLGLAQGPSWRMRARVVGRAPRTVSRDAARNGRGHPDRACTAQHQAAARARHPQRGCQRLDPWLWPYVETHLRHGCSPEQSAGRRRRADPDDMGQRLSAETRYGALYVRPRGVLRTERWTALRQARKARRPRSRGLARRGQRPNMTPMADRPAAVASRTVPGHGEGDRLQGARKGAAVGPLVERTTRLVILARMEGPDAGSAREGVTRKRRPVPAPRRNTRTDDRGHERAEHARLAQRLAIQIFVADRIAPGHAGPMTPPLACCASMGRRARICRATPRAS